LALNRLRKNELLVAGHPSRRFAPQHEVVSFQRLASP
jgi:hypothetical protein